MLFGGDDAPKQEEAKQEEEVKSNHSERPAEESDVDSDEFFDAVDDLYSYVDDKPKTNKFDKQMKYHDDAELIEENKNDFDLPLPKKMSKG